MGEPAPVRPQPSPDLLHRPLAMKAESVGYAFLALGDLIVSAVYFGWEGLWTGYEVNPLAAYVLRYYGIQGLVLYKAALTAGIVVACQIIWHTYPRLARGILIAGCLVNSYVIFRSVWNLYVGVGILPGG